MVLLEQGNAVEMHRGERLLVESSQLSGETRYCHWQFLSKAKQLMQGLNCVNVSRVGLRAVQQWTG